MKSHAPASPKVSVLMMSYNHADNLARAIDSVLCQKVNFDYEIIVHDDSSTDRSQAVLEQFSEQYPGKFKLILRKTNIYREGGFAPIFRSMVEGASGKYLATIECDDVWTDDNKLQKQVDLLEAHPEASLCAGGYVECFVTRDGKPRTVSRRRIIYRENGKLLTDGYGQEKYYFFTEKEWSRRWLTKTLTMVFRVEALGRLLDDLPKYNCYRDIHLCYYLLQEGCGIYLPQVLGTYQIYENGVFGARTRQVQRHQHEKCYRELWRVLRQPILLRLLIEKRLSLILHGVVDGQLNIPG